MHCGCALKYITAYYDGRQLESFFTDIHDVSFLARLLSEEDFFSLLMLFEVDAPALVEGPVALAAINCFCCCCALISAAAAAA